MTREQLLREAERWKDCGLLMPADARAILDLAAELAAVKADYDTLKRAVNESTNDCGPDCDSYSHGDKCPANDSARWLEDQQREIERLRKLDDDGYGGSVIATTVKCLEEAEAEVERLRGLLREWRQGIPRGLQRRGNLIIRTDAALAGEKHE